MSSCHQVHGNDQNTLMPIVKQSFVIKKKESQKKSNSYFINTDDDLFYHCFNKEYIALFICEFLTIEEIWSYNQIKMKHNILAKSAIISRVTLYSMIKLFNQEVDWFKPYNEKDCVKLMINSRKHPRVMYWKCISIEKCLKKQRICIDKSVCQNGYFYQLFRTPSFDLWNTLFKNNPVSHYIKLYLPFTQTKIEDHLIHKCHVTKFGKYIKSLNMFSNKLDLKFLNLWNLHSLSRDNENNDLKIYDRLNMDYLHVNYFFKRWYWCIDWDNFFIAGGSIFGALTNCTFSSSSDIDIFSIGISEVDFFNYMLEFQSKLREANINYQMNSFNDHIITFLLLGRNFQIKIQFIWTCQMASIAQILLSFDLAVSQVAYKPDLGCIGQLYFTDSFLYYIKTKKCIVYNNNSLNRMKKYLKKGVKKFLVLDNIATGRKEISFHEKDKYIKVTINDDEPIFLSKTSYYEDESLGHAMFRNKNYDYKAIQLKLFLQSILSHHTINFKKIF